MSQELPPGNKRQRNVGALSAELLGHLLPKAGFEPATSRLSGEVTLVFTTGENLSDHLLT